MNLMPGQQLAHYRIVEKIGAGGMGEIWRASDTTLDRDVAIKLLPADFASDPDRMARFEREAKVLASLNHPCIAQVYGFHEMKGVRFLAMELVRGEDLSQRLAQGPLPLKTVEQLARRIAQALEAAHESGVMHRDLKPANIILTPDGSAKVLDFGLAKVFAADPASGSGLSVSPTVTSGGTQAGVILGTAAYMSPEQARGKPLDRRSDIWSFGCVVYEMLTGRYLFRGETVSDTIALILQTEPDWAALPADVPPRLRELVARCVEKDPHQRLRDIGDARIELERILAGDDAAGALEAAAMPPVAARPRRRAVLLAGVFAVGLLAGAGLWSLRSSGDAGERHPIRVSIQAPPGIRPVAPSITPDGRAILFRGVPENPDPENPEPARLFLRSLDRAEAQVIPGTEGVGLTTISPDGDWLAYVVPVREGSTQRRLFKAPLDGSQPPLALADWQDNWAESILWLPSGNVLVTTPSPISMVRIASDGSGAAAPIPTHTDEVIPDLFLLDVLPDGANVLAQTYSWERQGYHSLIFALNVDSGAIRKVLDPGAQAHWAPTRHLVFTRLETLLAVPFDPHTLDVTGGPVALADGLWTEAGSYGAPFDLSRTGTLLHRPGGREGSRRRLVTVDRNGEVTPWSTDRLPFVNSVEVAPDNRHLAVTVMSLETLNYGVWISEMDRPGLRMWMTMPGLDCNEPMWHPDSQHLLFVCEGTVLGEGLYIAPLDAGEPPRLLYTEQTDSVDGIIDHQDIHPSGRQLLVLSRTGGRSVVLRVALDSEGRALGEADPLFPRRRRTSGARFSPDGNLVAYESDDSGRNELFVAPFHTDGSVGSSVLVRSGVQGDAAWLDTNTPDTFDLVFHVANEVLKVRIATAKGITISQPGPFLNLSKVRPVLEATTLLPDGRVFAVQDPDQRSGIDRRIDLVIHFDSELARLGR